MILKKVKIGDFGLLSQPFPQKLMIEFKKVVSEDFEVRLYELLVELKRCIDASTDYLELHIEYIKQKAGVRGVVLYAYPVCCHRVTCMTCLGTYQNHYPYFKAGEGWIKKEELESFLIGLEMTREEIELFKVTRDSRTQLIQIYHTLIMVFNYMGLSTITLKQGETD